MTESMPGNNQPEIAKPNITPEEACLAALLNFRATQSQYQMHDARTFFEVYTKRKAPPDLKTAMDVSTESPGEFSPPGADVVATVTVRFDAQVCPEKTLLNLDFVNTEEGMQIRERAWLPEVPEQDSTYIRTLDDREVRALQIDSEVMRQRVIETDLGRMMLGPLVEEAREDGTRRFHVSDILSVLGDKTVSARGMEGVVDILNYMTGESPATVQIGRFIQECAPQLREQYEELLKPYLEQIEQGPPQVELYQWLAGVSEAINEPLLEVHRLDPEQHVVIDPGTELKLDRGNEMPAVIDMSPTNEDET